MDGLLLADFGSCGCCRFTSNLVNGVGGTRALAPQYTIYIYMYGKDSFAMQRVLFGVVPGR